MNTGRRFLRIAGILLLQLLIVLVLLEVATRYINPLGISFFPETARYTRTYILEESIGYRHRPGLRGEFWGAPVEINSIGLRDREVGAKAPGEYRLLVLGDSVPFGIGVRYEDSFPHQLEAQLHRNHPGRRFRTINMGVPSYNTEQELIQFRNMGLSLQPDAVMLMFVDNDIQTKRGAREKGHRWYEVLKNSYAVTTAVLIWKKLGRLISPHGASTADPAGTDITRVSLEDYRPDSAPWQAVDRSLSAIHRLCKARKIPFVLFTNSGERVVTDLLKGVAGREGFPLVVLNAFEDPRWAGQDRSRFRISVMDAHPSTLGNLVFATLMAEHLDRLGVLRTR
jgi:hypothetical protein